MDGGSRSPVTWGRSRCLSLPPSGGGGGYRGGRGHGAAEPTLVSELIH